MGKNVTKSSTSGLSSSVLVERSSKLPNNREEHISAGVLDTKASLVISTNGKSQAEISVKDLMLYGSGTNSSTNSLISPIDEGLGIVKFLKGRSFFITGATGFLGKGIFLLNIFTCLNRSL